MSLKHLTIGTLVAICTFVSQGAAQKNELSGILGRTFIADQGIQGAPSYDPNLRFGEGLTFEVNYARRLMGTDAWSLALEVPFVVNPDEDAHTYNAGVLELPVLLCHSRGATEFFSRDGSLALGQLWWWIRVFWWLFRRQHEQVRKHHRCNAGWRGTRCEAFHRLQLAR